MTPDPSRLTQSKITGGYESSESSSDGKATENVSQFMNTLDKKSNQGITTRFISRVEIST